MSDVFLSYSSNDRKQALELADRLGSEGLSIWIDQSGISGAQNWSAEITDAIESCKIFLILLSESSVASHNCTRELALACDKKKEILPIDISLVLLPGTFQYYIAGIHRLPLDNFDAIRKAFVRLGLLESSSKKTEPIERDMIRRLAVLPFEDQSPNHDNEWFSDGLTDELISTLNKIEKVFIVDSQTAREYKNTKLNAKQIAGELNVRYIIRGAVRKAENNIRVQATLIDTETGATLLDQNFSGTMDDIFHIQEKAAKDISEGLKLKLTPEETKLVEKKLTDNAEAYALFLQASQYFTRETKQDYQYAIELGRSSVEHDPDFAQAHALLSRCFAEIYRLYDRTSENLNEAERYALKALELDNTSVMVYRALSDMLLQQNKIPEAIEAARKMIALDPEKGGSYFALGFIYEHTGQPALAAEQYEQAVIAEPDYRAAWFSLSSMYDRLGNIKRREQTASHALPICKHYLEKNPDDDFARTNYAILNEYAGRLDECFRHLERVVGKPNADGLLLYNAACIFARNDKKDKAVQLLKRAVDGGFSSIDNLRSDPDFNLLRDNKEFKELNRRFEKSAAKKQKTFHNTSSKFRSLASRRTFLFPILGFVIIAITFFLFYAKKKNEIRAEQKTIAVIPFYSRENDSVSHKLNNWLINDLSKITNLVVVPQEKLTRYFGFSTDNPAAVAEELGVRYVIFGSISKTEDSSVDIHIFDSKIKIGIADVHYPHYDFEAKHRELAGDIAALLGNLGIEHGLATENGTHNILAYTAILEARKSCWNKTTKSVNDAMNFFRIATQKDPAYSEAWAEEGYFAAKWAFEVDSMEEWAAFSKSCADKAIALDREKPQGYSALAAAYFTMWENTAEEDNTLLEQCLKAAEKARNLEPDNSKYISELADYELSDKDNPHPATYSDIQRAYQLDGQNAGALLMLLMRGGLSEISYQAKGDELFQLLMRIHPDDNYIKIQYARVIRYLGNHWEMIHLTDKHHLKSWIDEITLRANDRTINSHAWALYRDLEQPLSALDVLERLKLQLSVHTWENFKKIKRGEMNHLRSYKDPIVSARFKKLMDES